MLYTDLLFVYAFLPLTIIAGLFDDSAEYKNLILVISSLIFFTWGRPIIILLLFLTVFADYGLGFVANSKNKIAKYAGLLSSICLNCSFFVIFARNYLFKTGSVFEKFTAISFSEKLIPLGIAFYTIRGVSYVFDVFKGNVKLEKNPFCLLTYMTCYHFMLAGPIVRYGDVEPQIRHRTVTANNLSDGLTRFVFGLGKATLIAPAFSKLMSASLDFENTTTVGAVLGFVGFLGYYFWSFEGFTDMALGLGKTNGFSYEENMKPFYVEKGFSQNAYSFNGTLTKFFSDVLVYKGDKKILNLLTTLLCGAVCGLWYEFSKGTLGGAVLVAVFVLLEKYVVKQKFPNLPKIVVGIYTTVGLLLCSSFFMVDALWQWKDWVLAILGKRTVAFSNSLAVEILKENFVLILFGVVFAVPYVRDLFKKIAQKVTQKGGYGGVRIAKMLGTVAVLLMYTVESYQLAL